MTVIQKSFVHQKRISEKQTSNHYLNIYFKQISRHYFNHIFKYIFEPSYGGRQIK